MSYLYYYHYGDPMTPDEMKKGKIKRCPCWGDPCDPEGCNGTVEEYLEYNKYSKDCYKFCLQHGVKFLEWKKEVEEELS